MSISMKRAISLLLVLAATFALLPTATLCASAAEISYVYDGKYIYNWGTRGEEATTLSPNAEKFYDKYKSYDELSALSGGTGKSDAPKSALYNELKSIMTEAQSYKTSYSATKSLFKYTDCQDNGGKISSFYSGNLIGPSWDGGWNREHTWPNSKGLDGDDENDIMMLRPTSTSENSSRGNTAYGKSSGYYNPNSESDGKYDLRGDVARIFLYVYVRWGNINKAWGTGGVMESVDVLLEWMEADPVDTWELGRNDSVESITGTRNVFVDYPELAFILFGAEIPDDMPTPSGMAGNKCDHNNFDSGVIFAATCTDKGYTLFTCQTIGCGHSYKASVTEAKGHSYTDGVCVRCGGTEPAEPVKPTYVKEIATGVPYKLGIYAADKGMEYYFSGSMTNTYYGATDTAYENGVDVYAETTSGGYRLYFNDTDGKKQYINLVLSGTHYNFTYSTTASSVFTWDTEKYAFKTTVSGEVCYIGNFAPYWSISVLTTSKLQDSDYIARMYSFSGEGSGDGGDTPDTPCQHNYTAKVTAPTCKAEGYTTYTCSLCAHSYTGDKVAATGHIYTDDKCTSCGASKPSESQVKIVFNDKSYRTSFSSTKQVWEYNGITVTNNKATATSDVADYIEPVRFYMGSDVIIAYPGITKLEINVSGLASKYVNGWLNAPAEATVTNSGGKVTLVFDTPVDSVTYTSLSAQCRAYDITVYAGSGPASCDHSSTTTVGAISAGCTADGYTGDVICSSCRELITKGEVIPATKHSFGQWVEGDDGTKRRECDSCGYFETEGGEVVDNLAAFISAVGGLSADKPADIAYGEISAALQLYGKLTEAEKAEAAESFSALQAAITAYNTKATTANNEVKRSIETAFIPFAVSFTFLAALWSLLKKKIWFN